MTLVSERCLSENWSLRLWGGRWTPTRNVAAEGIPVTFRDTSRHRYRPGIVRVFALAGVAVGLILYVAAFFITAPTEVCMTRLTSHMTGSEAVVATSASAGKQWVGIVASRCQWTFATGPHAGASVSEHVVEWGPSALAIVGLVVAVAGVGSWMWFRTKHINVARTDRG